MPGTDVDRIVLDLLPRFPPGVLVHIHDVFLPDPYPPEWAWRGYNEQLLVGALLQGGAFELVFASRYVAAYRPDWLGPVLRLPLLRAPTRRACGCASAERARRGGLRPAGGRRRERRACPPRWPLGPARCLLPGLAGGARPRLCVDRRPQGVLLGRHGVVPARRDAVAGRIGDGPVLAAGTALAGAGFVAAANAGGFAALAAALLIAGAGAAAQHPLGSDIVARMTPPARRRQALGLYNTVGDIGKVLFPALATGALLVMPAAVVLDGIGAVAIVAGVLILAALPAIAPPRPAAGEPAAGNPVAATPAVFRQPGFAVLFGVGMIDTAARAGFLTFFPLALAAKGAAIVTIGLALTLVFVGGAIGKFVCGPLGARFGVFWTVAVTEGATRPARSPRRSRRSGSRFSSRR